MSNNIIETPVVIIGAGPAGVGTSIYLTLAGIKHVIIEKETFPRDKVCGDAISGKSAHVLRKANPAWLHEVYQQPEGFTPSRGIIFVAPNGKPLYIPYGDHLKPGELAPGFTSPRMIFDNFLFDKIDRNFATVYQHASVKAITKQQGEVTVEFMKDGQSYVVKSPVIVACDGDKGIVRKKFINDNASEKSYSVGLRAYYKNVGGLDPNGYIELHFLPEILPGYFWIFPLPNGMANVGVGILSERLRRKKINLREQMLKAIESNPSISHRFKGATLEGKVQGWGLPMGMKRESISGDNYILCGDAASLIDPFSGEGIGNALYSGMLAGEALSRCIPKNDFSAATLKTEYDDILYRRLGDEMRISATLQRLCRYPWLFNMVVNKANKSPSLSNMISGMFTDLDLREQLRKPSFYAKILLNK
ncbi:MAG TPA: geranylgeranyl reductase family protein [Flavipsychrobacter sp.]|nr:geranylgeranyl reductase family protein [Flavipsychrobacter sp.]